MLDAFSSGGAGNAGKSSRQGIWFADNLLFGVGKKHAMKVGGLFATVAGFVARNFGSGIMDAFGKSKKKKNATNAKKGSGSGFRASYSSSNSSNGDKSESEA